MISIPHSLLANATPIRELRGVDPQALPDAVLQSPQPVVLRGLVANWPMVRAARASDAAAVEYLRTFYRGTPVAAMFGPPENGGRFFYNEDLSGFNFRSVRAQLDDILGEILRHRDDTQPPAIYVGATTIDTWLPGFRADNDLDMGTRTPLVSAWIGNRSRVSAHQDVPDNLACVVAGRRRFTLFPPDQLSNLYIGPIDYTPAGQAVSLVDFANPDLSKYPNFAEAARHAQVAVLEAGDAVFIPSLWWHHIEALDAFNVLVNYWWRQAPDYADSPQTALMLAILSLRELPAEQRAAWQEIFRHYVFEPDENTVGHIPEPARRVLAPLDETSARDLRKQLLMRLTRP